MTKPKVRRGGTQADAGGRGASQLPCPVVGVGASAGGLEAFAELLEHIPRGPEMAFVLIQHLAPSHPSLLSEVLGSRSRFPVEEARDGLRIEPGHVYVIPSHADVGIFHGTLTLFDRPEKGSELHLPVDSFFKALAREQGGLAMGVVLSGTGADGSKGIVEIKAQDGFTFVQDPASAAFSGMPEAAVKTGAADFVLPIPELARELVRIASHPYLAQRDPKALAGSGEETALHKIFALVRNAVGVDFSEYKLSSVRRRLSRRMALRRVPSLVDYVSLLQAESTEAQALFEDILIHVTSFFRDADHLERLTTHVFPELLRQKRNGGKIRLWSAGCSTGEEAYSLVILLLEFLEAEGAEDISIQLFGTDISEKAIEHARAACYSDAAVSELSEERVARFFTKLDGGGYRINANVRERCAFVKHDLARDPPFSKLDLVCCRNVLIYFGTELQKRVLSTFHFALNEPGFLLLGRSENISEGIRQFRMVDAESKLFSRTAGKSSLRLPHGRELSARPVARAEPGLPSASDVIRRSELLLLEQYAPAGVIVNERMEIIHFRGRTGTYLEPSPGQPQHDLLKMARQGLVADLRIGLSQARSTKTSVRREGVEYERDGKAQRCTVVVVPVALKPEAREDIFAVLFEPSRELGMRPERQEEEAAGSPVSDASRTSAMRMEEELRSTKAYLQSLIEEHQRANEDLLSTNEELVSTNEELQSLNEEHQTAKEELQSTNEELATLNEELVTRNGELNSANSDLINILGSVDIPIVIVDGARLIRRFTPKARPLLNLLASDIGRPIDDIRPNLDIDDLDRKISEVIETVVHHEEEVRARDGRWMRLNIRPYTTVEKRIDGAVISVFDIDVLKRAIGAAEWARDYAQATVEAVQVPLVVLNGSLEIVSVNGSFQEHFGIAGQALVGQSLNEVMGGALDDPDLRAELEGVDARDERFQRHELECEIPRLGALTLSLSGRSVPTPDRGRYILLAVEDVTSRKRDEVERARMLRETEAAKASAEEANRVKDLFMATLSHELRTPLSSLLMSAQRLTLGGMDEEKLRKTGAVIERATRAQAQLIDDLLDISRIATGKLKIEREATDFRELTERATEQLRSVAESRRLELRMELGNAPMSVWGDPLRLQQVVSNLLTNAIKFTPEDGGVSVCLDVQDGAARLRVSDSGVGIDPDFLPHLFTRFTQEEQGRTRSQGGLGLGLALVQSLVEAHGGTVRAASEGRGRGSTFTVLLPLMESDEPARMKDRGSVTSDRGALAGARILVVEDDPGTREALTEMLAHKGAEVREAASAAEAFEAFEGFKPGLLISDIAMPNEDGYSLLRRIRSLGPERGGEVPALALTALASTEDRRRAAEAGFEVHVAKPVDTDRLVGLLLELLQRASSETVN